MDSCKRDGNITAVVMLTLALLHGTCGVSRCAEIKAHGGIGHIVQVYEESTEPGDRLSVSCSSPVGEAGATADMKCTLTAHCSSIHAGLGTHSGAGASFKGWFQVVDDFGGTVVAPVFRFSVSGWLELETEVTGHSTAGFNLKFGASAGVSRDGFEVRMREYKGEPSYWREGNVGVLPRERGMRADFAVGPDLPVGAEPLITDLLERIGFDQDLKMEWPVSESEATPFGVRAARIASFATEVVQNMLPEGVDIGLTFHVTGAYDVSASFDLEPGTSDRLNVSVMCGGYSSPTAEARGEIRASLSAVILPSDAANIDTDGLRVVFDSGDSIPVTRDPGAIWIGPDNYDFARFANSWARTDCNSSNEWCDGADVDQDGHVKAKDLLAVARNWLDGLEYGQLSWDSSQALYGGGSGTIDDPYLIYTVGQLTALSTHPSDWNKHFRLMADIVVGPHDELSPIGYRSAETTDLEKQFEGAFDGNGHTIAGLNYITDQNNVGLFGYTVGAEIKDMALRDPNIIGEAASKIGALVGKAVSTRIIGCRIEGGTITGDAQVGGMIGCSKGSWIIDCASSCSVRGSAAGVGGLVGETLMPAEVRRCRAEGTTVSDGNCVGGLIGTNEGYVFFSRSAGRIEGHERVGGLVGNSSELSCITDCYSSCDVVGDRSTGGLLGDNNGYVSTCYSHGSITGITSAGGLIGSVTHSSIVAASYWDVETSGQSTSAGGTGESTSEMQKAATYTSAGWDFTSPVWAIREGEDYPYLFWEEASPTPSH